MGDIEHWAAGMPRADMIDEIESLRLRLRNECTGRAEDLKDTERLREQLRGAVEELERLRGAVIRALDAPCDRYTGRLVLSRIAEQALRDEIGGR